MAANRGVHRPASIPSPGKSHAHGAKGGVIHGTVSGGGPMTGTGGAKTHAAGEKGGLILGKGPAMQSRGGKGTKAD